MILRTVLFAATVFLLFFPPTVLVAAKWYVDGSVAEPGDGTTSATAFKRIEEGIDATSDGDRVTVAKGSYVETIPFRGKNIVLQSTDPLDPAVVTNTEISAGKEGGSVVTFAGTEDETCILSGFTIRNDNGDFGSGVCEGTFDNSNERCLARRRRTHDQQLPVGSLHPGEPTAQPAFGFTAS